MNSVSFSGIKIPVCSIENLNKEKIESQISRVNQGIDKESQRQMNAIDFGDASGVLSSIENLSIFKSSKAQMEKKLQNIINKNSL